MYFSLQLLEISFSTYNIAADPKENNVALYDVSEFKHLHTVRMVHILMAYERSYGSKRLIQNTPLDPLRINPKLKNKNTCSRCRAYCQVW